jgi:DNA gyrase subunit B
VERRRSAARAERSLAELGFSLEDLPERADRTARFEFRSGNQQQSFSGLEQANAVVGAVASKDVETKRFKGLGEMDASQLWESTMDPATRTLYQVRLEDDVLADKLFTILMGEQVEPRRAYIERHALEVRNLDV